MLESEENECPDCHEKDIYPNTLIPNRFLRTSVNNFKNETGYDKMCKPIQRKIIHSPPKPIQSIPPPVIPTLSDFVAPENLSSICESKEKDAGLKNNNEENKETTETSTPTENTNGKFFLLLKIISFKKISES